MQKRTFAITSHQIKINSKWIINMNIKNKTTKLLKENTGENLYDLKLGKEFLNRIQKAQTLKENDNKLDFLKIF